MGTITWLLIVAVGIIAGVAIGRFWPLDSLRMRTIEGERDSARAELENYRQEVSTHFQRTGQLFDRITSDYRSLYEHLSSGAEQLCTPSQADVLQAEPEQRKLALAHAEAAAKTTPAEAPAAASGAAATVAAASAVGHEAAAPEENLEEAAQTDPYVASAAKVAAPVEGIEGVEGSPETVMSPPEIEAREEAQAAEQQAGVRPPRSEAGNGLDDTVELATIKVSAGDAANDGHDGHDEDDDSAASAIDRDPQGDDADAHRGSRRRASA